MPVYDPSFAPEEYRARVEKVQSIVSELNLDALLCHSGPNICYVAGVQSVLWYKYFMAVVPRTGDPILLSQDFEASNAMVGCPWPDVVTYRAGEDDPVDATHKLLHERGLADSRLGIELGQWSLSVSRYRQLQAALPQVTWVDASTVVERVKAIKSPAEIAYMRQAAQLTSAGVQAAIEAAAEGKTDNDLALAGYQAIIGGGSEYMCLDPIVTVGERSGVPHSTHRRRRIQRGDAIFFEMGANIHRYTAALMRTAVIGPPSDGIHHAAEACIISLNTVIENMRPGAMAADIAAKADRSWADISKRLVWHGIYAYSLGLGFPPDWNDCNLVITHDSPAVLEPGMVFHVTTSRRVVGRFGTAFSETVLITPDGHEVLTQLPRELAIK